MQKEQGNGCPAQTFCKKKAKTKANKQINALHTMYLRDHNIGAAGELSGSRS